MVNYLSIYLKDLQLKLIPIYNLTRKGIPFVWGEEQYKAFEDIKKALTSPPVLVMPNSHGHIIFVSDTSNLDVGERYIKKLDMYIDWYLIVLRNCLKQCKDIA